MDRRLTIVVPYRDRAGQLARFVPELGRYLAGIRVASRLLVVEQEAGLPFNRGALKNIGFALGRDGGDYTCFHDVDYLPVEADYSWADRPTRIIWRGAEERPLAPGRSMLAVRHDPATFFGGVVLVPNALFAAVNGYSNRYWGWGYEDSDLRQRYWRAGIGIGIRQGAFLALDHDHDGYTPEGSPTPAAQANRALFEAKWAAGGGAEADGLSDLAFAIRARRPLAEAPGWEMVTVGLAG